MLNETFDNMKADLSEDPFNFVVDSLTFLKCQQALYTSEPNPTEPALLEQSESGLEVEITKEWQATQMKKVSKANVDALRVYNNEDSQYAQILSAETLPVTRRFIHKALAAGTGAGWLWVVATGTGTYTFLAGVPLLAAMCTRLISYDSTFDATETVKDIYLRKEDGKLDIYFWKAGQYTRMMEAVEPTHVEVCSGNPMVSNFDNSPVRVQAKSMTLGELKSKGLPGPLSLVNINGKAHFMHSNYRLNKNNSSLISFT